MIKFILKSSSGAKKHTRYISLFFLTGLIISFTACEDKAMDMSMDMRSLDAGNQIEFKTTPQTRSAENLLFDVGDTIGIYSVIWQPDNQTPGELQSSGNYDDNKPYNLIDENDNWTSPDPIYYPIDGSKIDLYAYYPWQENPMNNNAALNVSVHEDQRSLHNYKMSDFKAAVTRGLNYESGPFHFEFYHRLSQIKFEIIAGTGVRPEQLTVAQIKLTNVITDGTYSFTDGNPDNVTTGSSISDITPCGMFQLENNKVTGKAAIIIPQTLGIENQIEVIFANRTISAGFDQPVTFGMGESRLVTITLNADGIDFTTEIKPWDEQPPIEEEDLIASFDINCTNSNKIELTLQIHSNLTINWGDGNIETIQPAEFTLNHVSHTYNTVENHIFHVRIYGEKTAMQSFIQDGDLNDPDAYIQGSLFFDCSGLSGVEFNEGTNPRITDIDVLNSPFFSSLLYHGDKENKSPLAVHLPQSNNLYTILIYNTENLQISPLNNLPNLFALHLINVGLDEIDLSNIPGYITINLSLNKELDHLALPPETANLTLDECISLKELNLTNQPRLYSVSIQRSGIERIIQEDSSPITIFDASGTKISAIDLSLWPNITEIYLNSTSISELDFTDHYYIQRIKCKDTPLNNNQQALLDIANSLPRKSDTNPGIIDVNPEAIPVIQSICNAKNWEVYSND